MVREQRPPGLDALSDPEFVAAALGVLVDSLRGNAQLAGDLLGRSGPTDGEQHLVFARGQLRDLVCANRLRGRRQLLHGAYTFIGAASFLARVMRIRRSRSLSMRRQASNNWLVPGTPIAASSGFFAAGAGSPIR